MEKADEIYIFMKKEYGVVIANALFDFENAAIQSQVSFEVVGYWSDGLQEKWLMLGADNGQYDPTFKAEGEPWEYAMKLVERMTPEGTIVNTGLVLSQCTSSPISTSPEYRHLLELLYASKFDFIVAANLPPMSNKCPWRQSWQAHSRVRSQLSYRNLTEALKEQLLGYDYEIEEEDKKDYE